VQARRAHLNAIKAPLSALINRTVENGCTVMQLPCNEDGSPIEDLCLPEDNDNNNAANPFMSVTAFVLHIVPASSVIFGLAINTTCGMVCNHLKLVFALQLLHVLCKHQVKCINVSLLTYFYQRR